MKRKILSSAFIAIFAINVAFSQTKLNVDSLTAVLNQYPKDDTVKVKLLFQLTDEIKKTDTKKAMQLSTQAITVSEKIQNDFWIGRAYYNVSDIYFRTGELQEAKLYCEKSISYFQKSNNKDYVGTTTMRMGSIAARSRDFVTAIRYYDEAMIVFDETKNIAMKSKVLIGLAAVSADLGNYDKAKEYNKVAIELNEKSNDKGALAMIYNNLYTLYITSGNYTTALDYAQKGIKLSESVNDLRNVALINGNIGSLYFNMNDNDEAQKYCSKAIDIYQKINDKRGINAMMISLAAMHKDPYIFIAEMKKAAAYSKEAGNDALLAYAHQNLAAKYVELSNFKEAYAHVQDGLNVEKRVNTIENIILLNNVAADILTNCTDSDLLSFNIKPQERYEKATAYLDQNFKMSQNANIRELQFTWLHQSKIYEKQGDFVKAYDYYRKYIALQDSTSSDNLRKQITRKEIQYEYDKKEIALKYEQQLTADELEKQQLLTLQQGQILRLKEQALALSNKDLRLSNQEKDLVHLAYLKEQAEKQEKMQQLSLSKEREKGKERDLALKSLELSAQQKQNIFLGLFTLILLGGLGVLSYFYGILKTQKNIIAQQNELNEQTIAILSHDIKEPLLGVKLMLKKLNKDDPFVAQASQSLESQINAVNGILTNLLKMKKMALLKKDKNAVANVNTVINNVVQELGIAIQNKDLTINNELRDELAMPIAPEKLQIVVHNLLSNAVKYSFSHQTIRIFKEGNGFCIQDFGVGLSPEQRTKLMREVTASKRGTKQEIGNGLGLYLIGAMLQGEKIKVMFDSPDIGGTLARVMNG